MLVALAVVAALGWLFVAAQSSRGKKCHLNVHFAKKVVCTKPDHHGLSATLMSPGSQDGLHRLEPRGAIAAESDRCLCTVEKARIHVQRQMGRAEIEDDLSGQLLLTRRPAHGERLHPRLDALQTPDVRARPRNAAALGSVELAGG